MQYRVADHREGKLHRKINVFGAPQKLKRKADDKHFGVSENATFDDFESFSHLCSLHISPEPEFLLTIITHAAWFICAA